MLTRTLTSIVGIPLAIFIIASGSPFIEIGAIVIALIGTYEFYSALKERYKIIPWIGYLAVIVYCLDIEFFSRHFIAFSAILLIALLMVMVFKFPNYSIADVGVTFLAPLYIAGLLSFIVLLRQMDNGQYLVWFIVISAWGSDTFAYFAGKLFGKHKLAPILSPKKTIEGSIGGAIGATVLAIIYTMIYAHFSHNVTTDNMFILASIVFVAAILSQIGDLAASAIKRDVGVKDYGNLFPGHGGVLDRFDSVLFVAPFMYIAINVLLG